MIEATEQLWHDQQLRLGEAEHVVELVLAEDRHQGIDDRADPERRQCNHRELPPVRQLNRYDIACTDTETT